MALVKGREYIVNGERLTYVRHFLYRGLVRRFAYPNGQVVDYGPGEITSLVQA